MILKRRVETAIWFVHDSLLSPLFTELRFFSWVEWKIYSISMDIDGTKLYDEFSKFKCEFKQYFVSGFMRLNGSNENNEYRKRTSNDHRIDISCCTNAFTMPLSFSIPLHITNSYKQTGVGTSTNIGLTINNIVVHT